MWLEWSIKKLLDSWVSGLIRKGPQDPPEDGMARGATSVLRSGVQLVRLGRREAALERFSDAYGMHPEAPVPKLWMATLLWHRDQRQEATRLANESLSSNPYLADHIPAVLGMARDQPRASAPVAAHKAQQHHGTTWNRAVEYTTYDRIYNPGSGTMIPVPKSVFAVVDSISSGCRWGAHAAPFIVGVRHLSTLTIRTSVGSAPEIVDASSSQGARHLRAVEPENGDTSWEVQTPGSLLLASPAFIASSSSPAVDSPVDLRAPDSGRVLRSLPRTDFEELYVGSLSDLPSNELFRSTHADAPFPPDTGPGERVDSIAIQDPPATSNLHLVARRRWQARSPGWFAPRLAAWRDHSKGETAVLSNFRVELKLGAAGSRLVD